VNHRGLLRAIVEHAGIPLTHETVAIVAVDKLDKVGADGVLKELQAQGIEADSAGRLVALATGQVGLADLRRALAESVAAQAALDEIERVWDFASVNAAGAHLEFDVSLARGLGYYTGCIFEAAIPGFAGSCGGGGRYDGLIGMFLGKQVPACGFSLGLERLLVLMEEQKLYPADIDPVHALLAPVDEADMKAALTLAVQLRAAGLRVDLVPKASQPGKLRKQADDQGIAAAVWIDAGQSQRANMWRKNDGSTHKDLDLATLTEQLRAAAPASAE
ncbi:MAG: histidyl-tRNA synthetase, partial [Pseudomonadota bacterium]